MFAYIEILRPINCLIAMLAVIAGGLISAQTLAGLYSMNLFFAIIAVFFIVGAGNVFNDYVDVEADKINRPKRPIPSGRISKKNALIYSLLLFAIGIIICGFVNTTCFLIALINSLLLVLYSYSFQHKVLLGNIIIGYLVGSVFIFGGAAIGNMTLSLILAVLSGLAIFSREIIKDLEDIEGDKWTFLLKKEKKGMGERFVITNKGVKPRISEKLSLITASIALLIAVLVSYVPYYMKILHQSYMGIVIPADIIFLFCIMEMIKRKRDYHTISKWMKTGMVLALAAFIVGVLI
jgi:geranylgeranylglycerol-phosphate geranylgeranyltransferase